MVRWRWSVIFLVLLVPARLSAKMDKIDKSDENSDENDDHGDDNDNNDDDDYEEDDDDDEDGGGRSKLERTSPILRRTSASFDFSTGVSSTTILPMVAPLVGRTTKKKPLECYVCTYKKSIALQACLDPWKHRVHTVICQSLTDRCYTWIVSKDGKYETVTRGCKTACVSSPEAICCEFNRCNNQALTLPNLVPQVLSQKIEHKTGKSLAKRPIPPTIMFFVTVLLLLQTVVKVPII